MRGHTDNQTILVIINGRIAAINGMKKRATCNDVINMAASMVGSEHGVLALLESSNGKERVLSPHTNIWKVIRSWGNDTSYSLVLKPADCLKKNLETVSRAKRNLDKLRSAISFKKTNLEGHDIAQNLDTDLKTTKTKSLAVFEDKLDNLCEKKGKLALFHRYISDVLYHKPKPMVDTASIDSSRLHGDGSICLETDSLYTNDLGIAGCNATYTIESAEEDTIYHEYTDDDMNMAFVNETVETSDVNSSDILNQRIHTDNSVTSDESGFDDVSICSINELEKNVFDCEFDMAEASCDVGWTQEGRTPHNNTVIRHELIKNIFRERKGLASLDDSLESFMNTRMNAVGDDEALSSLGSDFGSV